MQPDSSDYSATDVTKFKALHMLYWSGYAFYQMFIVYYLTVERGYNNATVGLILSIAFCVTLFGQNFWGIVADKIRNIKLVLIILFTGSTVFVSTFPLNPSLLTIGIAACLIMFFDPIIPPILDSWTTQYIDVKKTSNYGSIRLWGSAGFAVFATLISRLSIHIGVEKIFHFHFLMAGCAIIVAMKVRHKANYFGKVKILSSLGTLFKTVDYPVFLICSTIVHISFRMSLTYMPLLIVRTGGDQSHLSIAWVMAGASEALLLPFAHRIIKRFGMIKPCIFAFIIFTLRIFLFYFAQSYTTVLASQMLHGLSFGLFLAASIAFVNSVSPDSIKTSALTIAVACYTGISGIISSFFGGVIIDRFGLSSMYATAMVINVIAIAAFYIYFIIYRRSNSYAL